MTERECNERFKRAWFKRGASVRYIGTVETIQRTGLYDCRVAWEWSCCRERLVGQDGVKKSISYKMTEPVEKAKA